MSVGIICPVDPEFVQRIRSCATRDHLGQVGEGPWPAQWGSDLPHERAYLTSETEPQIGYHCTIAYLGDRAQFDQEELDQMDSIYRTSALLSALDTCDVRATHVAQWPQDDGVAIVALIEGPMLSIWRDLIRRRFPPRLWRAPNPFAFRPHITLGYFPHGPEGLGEAGTAIDECKGEIQGMRFLVSPEGAT